MDSPDGALSSTPPRASKKVDYSELSFSTQAEMTISACVLNELYYKLFYRNSLKMTSLTHINTHTQKKRKEGRKCILSVEQWVPYREPNIRGPVNAPRSILSP